VSGNCQEAHSRPLVGFFSTLARGSVTILGEVLVTEEQEDSKGVLRGMAPFGGPQRGVPVCTALLSAPSTAGLLPLTIPSRPSPVRVLREVWVAPDGGVEMGSVVLSVREDTLRIGRLAPSKDGVTCSGELQACAFCRRA